LTGEVMVPNMDMLRYFTLLCMRMQDNVIKPVACKHHGQVPLFINA